MYQSNCYNDIYNQDAGNFLYNDVVITPYLSPNIHYYYPSLLGNISANINYVDHFKFMDVQSKRCKIIDYEYTIDEPCIFCGFMFNAFGHFIIESISTAWFIKRLPSHYNLYYAYNSVNSKKLDQYQRDVFNFIGIRNNVYFIDKVTKFKNCYIPPAGSAIESFYTPEQENAVAVCECNIQPGKKTFISRSKFSTTRGCKNEWVLDKILSLRGWNVIYPEKLPFHAQIEEIASSETVFCTSGSALHSLIFIKNPRQKFVVMPRGHGPTFNMIAKMKSSNYYLLNIDKKIVNKGRKECEDTYEINEEQILRAIKVSNDFDNLQKIDNLIQNPDIPDFNWRFPPEKFFAHETVPTEEDSLFYLVIYYSNNDPKKAKTYILSLLEKLLVRQYMVFKLLHISKMIDIDIHKKVSNYVNIEFPELYSIFRNQ